MTLLCPSIIPLCYLFHCTFQPHIVSVWLSDCTSVRVVLLDSEQLLLLLLLSSTGVLYSE